MNRAIPVCLLALCASAQTVFEFHSGFWVNLHHFLYEQARSSSPVASDLPEWQRALEYYKRKMVSHDVLSREMEAVNNTLSDLESATTLKSSKLESELITVLEDAAPEYRKRWWPEHDRANHAWIAAVEPLVEKHAAALTRELAAAYGTDWPATPIRTDVAAYANWAGAYTTLYPTHITISSTAPDYAGRAALEMLFHEASHALIQRVSDALTKEARAQGRLFPRRDVWHALLFYTTGQIVTRHLDDYTPYAIRNGLYEQGWKGTLPVFDKDWKPYLDGKVERAEAIRRFVADYGIAPVR